MRRSAQITRIQASAKRCLRDERIRELLSVAAVIALAAMMVGRGFTGDWPVGHDHPVHIARIWHLKRILLQHGTPWGWTNAWYAGCPVGSVYPFGADLLVLSVHALTFGFLGIPQSYAVAFALFYCGYAYAVYYFVSRALSSRVTAIVAVLLLISEAGNNDVGGWFWLVDAGVWTAALAMIPALIGTIQIARLFEKPEPRHAAVVGICVGLSLLCHEIALVYFALAVAVLCVCRFVLGERTNWRAAFLWLAIAGIAGLFIASVWLAPHFAMRHYVTEIGALGRSITQLGEGIEKLRLFPRMWWLPAGAGVIGSVALLFSARTTLPLFVAAFGFIAVTLSSSTFVQLFGAGFSSWAGKHMIFERLLMLAKPCWCGAGALLLTSAARGMRDVLRQPIDSTRSRPLLRNALAIALALCFIAPLLYCAARIFLREELFRPTEWHSRQRDLQDREDAVAWLNAVPRKRGEIYRVAHGFDNQWHHLSDLELQLHVPMFKVSNTPAAHFIHSIDGDAPPVLRAANVRFALATKPLRRPDLVLERSFGGLHIYRVTNWTPDPLVIRGSGHVSVEKFADERIVLRAAPGASGVLRLNVSYVPSWRATRDGQPVPITAAADPAVPKSSFMEVPLAPGVYRFQYHRTAGEYAGGLLSLIGWCACVGLLYPQKSGRIVRRFLPAKQ